MINTYSISIDGHVFETSSSDAVRNLLNKYSSENDILICRWNDSKGEYERISIESVLNPEPFEQV